MRMIEQTAPSGISRSYRGVAEGIAFPSSSATTSHPLAASVIISMVSSRLFSVVMYPGSLEIRFCLSDIGSMRNGPGYLNGYIHGYVRYRYLQKGT